MNTKNLLQRCLDSIDPLCEVIVVDNASSDGSIEMVTDQFPQVRLIANSDNRGFGPANNQGIEIASRPYVLLLNSDAYATPGAIATLAGQLSDESVIACGGKLLHLSGELQESCCNRLTLWAVVCEQLYLEKLFRGNSLFSPYWKSKRIVATGVDTAEVEQVMGACLMFRPIERFDERFFLYCEDTELCYRLRKHGKILYVPRAPFYHELGASTKNRWRAIAFYNRGKELYFAIHSGRAKATLCFILNRKGALLRLIAWSIACLLTVGLRASFRSQVACFARVLACRIKGPRTPVHRQP
jgi:GT2 family glycosyltransferase